MGIYRLPGLESYWSLRCQNSKIPGVSQVMSRVRFEQIFRSLHSVQQLTTEAFWVPRPLSACQYKKINGAFTEAV